VFPLPPFGDRPGETLCAPFPTLVAHVVDAEHGFVPAGDAGGDFFVSFPSPLAFFATGITSFALSEGFPSTLRPSARLDPALALALALVRLSRLDATKYAVARPPFDPLGACSRTIFAKSVPSSIGTHRRAPRSFGTTNVTRVRARVAASDARRPSPARASTRPRSARATSRSSA